MKIESLDNPRVKDVVRLRDRRGRRKAGRFAVEGRRELERALAGGFRPEALFSAPDVWAAGTAARAGAALRQRCEEAGARCFEVTSAVYRKLAVREDDEGVIAVFSAPEISPDSLRLPPRPLVLAAVGIEKPGNLGALLRSADGFGVDAFVATGGTDFWNPNVIRASVGSVFTVPVAAAAPSELLPWMRAHGLRVAAATPDGDVSPADAPFTDGVALLMGSEEEGLPPDLLAAADLRLRIPMRGAADSLNVSVAAGVLLYEATRQRGSAAE